MQRAYPAHTLYRVLILPFVLLYFRRVAQKVNDLVKGRMDDWLNLKDVNTSLGNANVLRDIVLLSMSGILVTER